MIYIHDIEAEMLYAVPDEPTITTKTNRRDVAKAYKVTVDIQVSTPHNTFKKNQWRIPLTQSINDEYPLSKKQSNFISLFKRNYYPQGDIISKKEYLSLKDKYDDISGVSW